MFNKKLQLILLYGVTTTPLIFLVGVLLRSGYQFIGDGQIFVFRDKLLIFLIVLVCLYLLTLILCVVIIRLPVVDYANRIIVINTLTYGLFGFALAFLRIPLYSRTLIISEFILSTILILLFFWLKIKFLPIHVGVFGYPDSGTKPFIRAVQWVYLEDADPEKRKYIDIVAANLHDSLDSNTTARLATFSQKGIPIYDEKRTLELLTGKIDLNDLTLGEIDSLNQSRVYSKIKRILDLLLTVAVSPILVILGSVAALLIKLDSPGTIFFKQERIGYNGNGFIMYKFRSMCMDESTTTTRFALEDDDRITRVGRYLRNTRLDELPQFLNVLRGEMSIIGPRPEQRGFAGRFENSIPFYTFRHIVRPGITGWAQTMYGYAADENQTRHKLEYDFFYIKNLSFWLDIVIIFKTVNTLLFVKGAR
jgi:lipopolysaccharide/colanic/teichoic acid biosynthesis glycosyltransferase